MPVSALADGPGSVQPPVDARVVAAGRANTAGESEVKATEALEVVQGPRDRALAQLARGLARSRQGRYRAALPDLKAAAEGPLAIRDLALFHAAEATFHQGDYAAAADLLRALLKKYPHSDWRHRAHFRLADCERGLGHLKQAKAGWEAGLARYPEYPHPVALRFAMAEVDHQMGRLAPAAERLREIMDGWPHDPLTVPARRLLEGLKGQIDEVPTSTPEAMLANGEDLRRRKFFGAALQVLQKLLTHPRADVGLKRRARLQIGRTLLQAERLDEALATFDLLCAQSAGGLHRSAQYWRSETLGRLGRTAEAAQALIVASGRKPDRLDGETREKLALLFFNAGDYPEALKRYAELGGAVGPWMRAWLAWRGGHYKEARDGFLRLGTGGRWGSDKHLYWAARADVQLGDFVAAKAAYLKVYQQAPGSYYAWQARARLAELGVVAPAPVERACEGESCASGDGSTDPIAPLQALATGWGGAISGLEASLELAVLGQERMATWTLRAVRDELMAYSLSGRPRSWRFLFRPYVDNRADEETRAEWGRLLDDKPVVSDARRTAGLREARGSEFNRLIEEGFRTLGDHYYVRRINWRNDRPREPVEAPANNAAWRLRFARAYRSLVEQHAAQEGVDPYLIWSFMAVESSFNPWALSRASARGLMQVMPHTGALIGDHMALRNFGTSLLFEPEIVVELAAWYVHQLLLKFDGQLPLAIAGYNAGPHRVAAWLDAKGQLPMDEFIEEMPYDEAREYTKKVLRHLVLYHRVYTGRVIWPVSQVIDPRYRDNINF